MPSKSANKRERVTRSSLSRDKKTKKIVAELINPEEVVEPIDNASLEDFEADEHPEVVRLAMDE